MPLPWKRLREEAFQDRAAPEDRIREGEHAEFHAKIVEVEIGGVAIYRTFGEFRRAKLYGHLYGAQGQRQAYF
ncbi:hypothetical protein TNCV_3412821 [Trichonephila clavipes]|uniref:Uncharacterized protein n=1 Tax=Trichonephila clavipes TaxID=2585209 RepID=A0A8X6RJW9_TRICX|nr:hypothetical protein TNCV_3412821 [Trichonephila clavipes]